MTNFREARAIESARKIDPGHAEILYHRHRERRPQIDVWVDEVKTELGQIYAGIATTVSELRHLKDESNWEKDREDNGVYPAEAVAEKEAALFRLEDDKEKMLNIMNDLRREAEHIDLVEPCLKETVDKLEAERKKEPEVNGDDDDFEVVQR